MQSILSYYNKLNDNNSPFVKTMRYTIGSLLMMSPVFAKPKYKPIMQIMAFIIGGLLAVPVIFDKK